MAAEEGQVLMQWHSKVRMLSSKRLWKMFLLVFGIPALLLGILVSFIADPATGALACGGGFALFAVVWALVGVAVDLGGGFSASYVVTDKGVHFASGKGARAAAEIAAVGGLLAGKPGMAGAGMLARAEQDTFLAWDAIGKVSVSDGSFYIELRGKSAAKPVGLYCTPENFHSVRELVLGRVVAGRP
ncbi:MAG: hypothetical protein JSS40_13140 [Proteobacteria bacterium]|nr:hypothetical protein [Pseudomonadota bacterium]